jgi:serine/threonine protein kinase/WD40 repeat protein/tetratricopeptide (TPR) repeat protein
MSENPNRAKEIFVAALKLAPGEWAAYLNEACGQDQTLHDRVHNLLHAHREGGSFLQPPSEGPLTADCPAADRLGTIIGPYKLLQQIGEGGMGTVFMAEQEQPVRRKVALKIVKPGMDSRQVVARFEAERQALAMMDHQNIARVYDAGTTDTGRPYFVMELVHGVPMSKYCDDYQLTVRERLELFVPVCKAIQHAHQKGIIHRDLKPSNVLICLYDGQPVPKVIDFGVAKAVEQRLTERTMFTQFGQIVGTFEYMSPEQAEMSQLGVDTRSDIYSLGVMLYELLTGSTPFQRLREAGLTEMLRTIKEVEPPRPSTRLSSTREAAKIAGARGTEPVKLAKLVRGELDWIVMKALEKDRQRRYETANGLARDIQRYLADEPVEACPPSAGYRLWKFARKYRSVMATVGAFVLVLAAAALASTWQAIRATLLQTKAQQAQTRAEEQSEKAREAQAVAQAERQQAVTNLYRSLVEEAAALRQARNMGYRSKVFERLQQALKLDTPDRDMNRLRDEAVACLGDFVGLEPTIMDDFPAAPTRDVRRGIQKIALTPDGEHMVIALEDGTIQVRNVSTRAVVARLSESAVGLGIDSENRWLVTADAKGTVKVWPDYGTSGAPAARTFDMGADFAGMSSNGRFSVGLSTDKDGKLLRVWDVARQKLEVRLSFPPEESEGPLQVSGDGQWVAQASKGGTKLYALVWNTSAPEPKKIIFADTNQDTVALAISQDGRFLACQHGDDGLLVLDVREAAPLPLIRDHEVLAAGFSPDGKYLVYCTSNVKLWDLSTYREAAALDHPAQGISASVTFSADGNTFATANRNNHSIRIWNLSGTGEKLVLAGHDNGVPDVAFSPDGKILASGSKDRWVKLWDVATGRLQRKLPRFESSIQSIAFSPDGRLLATGQFGPAAQPVQIWDLETETPHAFVPSDDELGQSAYGVAFSPDGKYFAACGNGLTIWRISEGVKGQGSAVGSQGSGVRGKKRSDASPVSLHASFERVAHLPGSRSLYLRISPNGNFLAWSDHHLLVCLWDLAKGREIPFSGPLGNGWHDLAFYPDSDHLTFANIRGMVEVWDIRNSRSVYSFGQSSGVESSLNGRWLATTALWSSKGSHVFALPPGPLHWCTAVSLDGERLAFGMADGGVAVWSIPRIQSQLARIGLAWKEGGQAPRRPEPQPFVPTTPFEQKLQVMHYSNLGRRLAWVGRLTEAEEAYRAAVKFMSVDLGAHEVHGKPLQDEQGQVTRIVLAAQAHEDLGNFLEDQARPKEAEAEFSEAIQLQPEHGSFWVQRGGAYAELGQWDRASADFVQATRCREPDADAWYSRAMLCLRDGHLEGYREVCSDMLQRFGKGAVWTCTLTPNSGADPARIAALAEKAITESDKGQGYVNEDHWHVNQLGAALYRTGRFEEAVKRLTEATKLNPHPYRSNMLPTWFFLAMANHRLGHAEEARRWLDKAVQGTDEALKPPAELPGNSRNPDGVIAPNWSRKLTLLLLRREAEELIQGPGTNPAK